MTFFGNLTGTTSMVRQREDGVNIAILFNKRRGKEQNEDNEFLQKLMDEVIDKINKGK